MTTRPPSHRICLIGIGTIGISFAALHLRHSDAIVSIYDTREDLHDHLNGVLPGYLEAGSDSSLTISHLVAAGRLRICDSLAEACRDATIVQEQGPENAAFKQSIWPQIENLVPRSTHLWSSTSGIAASIQTRDMVDHTRLLVVHPFNPPHIMPLIEIVPSPETSPAEVDFAREYFSTLGSGHRPVVIHKEVPGFVGNRLAFTLLREACSLVGEGVISAKDLDTLVESSIGPRWAVQGPFKSYNLGGGSGGLAGFLTNLSSTIQGVWDDQKPVNFGEAGHQALQEDWTKAVIEQTSAAYGRPDADAYAVRDETLRKVLQIQADVKAPPPRGD